MFSNLGYKKNLFILPFDHRSSFAKLFRFTNTELTQEEKEIITKAKEIVYMAFEKAISEGISKDNAAILVDEEYSDKIILDAINKDYNVILTTEKSGQKEFTFEYGDEFRKHIEKYAPNFVKALIHYNPDDDPLSKMRQQEKLQILNNYCHQNSYKFLLEVLISPTGQQLNKVNGDKEQYDTQIRPSLTVASLEELQNTNVEPDIWKIEGMENEKDCRLAVSQAQKGERKNVGIVILGRAENQEKVEKWIAVGAKVKGVIGFAVGRTVFWKPLVKFFNKVLSREETINAIAKNFIHFYTIFNNNQQE